MSLRTGPGRNDIFLTVGIWRGDSLGYLEKNGEMLEICEFYAIMKPITQGRRRWDGAEIPP